MATYPKYNNSQVGSDFKLTVALTLLTYKNLLSSVSFSHCLEDDIIYVPMCRYLFLLMHPPPSFPSYRVTDREAQLTATDLGIAAVPQL